jgi:hypothetical protein
VWRACNQSPDLSHCGAPAKKIVGDNMTDHISPEFHAELIVELFNDYRDLRKVREKAKLLLSRASPEHLEQVGRNLPEHLVHVATQRDLRAA